MTTVEAVRACAKSLKLVNEQGELRVIDSFGIVDLVIELEMATRIVIPPDLLLPEHFKSIVSIAKLLDEIRPPTP